MLPGGRRAGGARPRSSSLTRGPRASARRRWRSGSPVRSASRFPDGQLYVNLRGFDPAARRCRARHGAAGFFDALGVPPRHVPATLDAQSALLRSLLDGRRMLLLLDNAHSRDQVRPLLPGQPGLHGGGHQPSPADRAGGRRGRPPAPARRALQRRGDRNCSPGGSAPSGWRAEPDAVAALVEHCAGLPLALSVTCARAVTRPGVALGRPGRRARDARGRLDALRDRRGGHRPAGGLLLVGRQAQRAGGADVPAARPAPRARYLRRRGGLPGRAHGRPRHAAALAELTRASLLTEDAAGRFGCHDLLRAYAAELAAATLSARRSATGRRGAAARPLRADRARGGGRLYPARGHVELPPGRRASPRRSSAVLRGGARLVRRRAPRAAGGHRAWPPRRASTSLLLEAGLVLGADAEAARPDTGRRSRCSARALACARRLGDRGRARPRALRPRPRQRAARRLAERPTST